MLGIGEVDSLSGHKRRCNRRGGGECAAGSECVGGGGGGRGIGWGIQRGRRRGK